MIQQDTRAWSGPCIVFRIHEAADGEDPIFSESQEEVLVTVVLVTVGSDIAIPQLQKVWMEIEVDNTLEPRMEISNYRSVVQG